jgi:hypothetical protein
MSLSFLSGKTDQEIMDTDFAPLCPELLAPRIEAERQISENYKWVKKFGKELDEAAEAIRRKKSVVLLIAFIYAFFLMN